MYLIIFNDCLMFFMEYLLKFSALFSKGIISSHFVANYSFIFINTSPTSVIYFQKYNFSGHFSQRQLKNVPKKLDFRNPGPVILIIKF